MSIQAPDGDYLNDRSDYQRCFVCGQRNASGLRVEYALEGDTVVTRFTPAEEHQGYPGFCHGGILTSLLDETAGRAAMLRQTWVMSMKLEVKFRQPVRVGQALVIRGHAVRWKGRLFEGRAVVELPDGSVAAEAHGLFARLPEALAKEAAASFPGFERFWEETDLRPR